MVSQLNRNTPAREVGYEMIQYICARHTLSAADTPAYTKIGTVPAGAVVVALSSRVATAVTGGTPVLGIGSASGTVGTNGNVQNVMAETAGSEWLTPLAAFAAGPLAADTDFFVGTTGGATAGDVYAAVFFIKPLL